MIESFVDLTYRGLSLGRRVKLAEIRPSTGYVEMPSPMPVGTHVAIITDDTVALDAIVVEVHEQVAGSDRVPGMVVKPKLDGEVARAWWTKRVTLPELMKPVPPPPTPAPPVIPPVVVVSKRMTHPGIGVPELMDDGQDTGVMAVVAEPVAEPVEPAVAAIDPDAGESVPNIVDDGRKTIAMDAVDLAALGLTPSTGPLAVVGGDDDDGGNGNGDKTESKSRRKRKKR